MARIGIIQTGGIGDIIIALPIADFMIERGHEVVWPIHAAYLGAFQRAKPGVRWLGVPDVSGKNFVFPQQLLQEAKCNRIITLYNFLSGFKVYDEELAKYLKFDEYKYAVAKVPFEQKWSLKIERDMQRERALHKQLNITRPYICVHHHGSTVNFDLQLPPDWRQAFQVVEITPLTDSPFDWIYTLEKASKLMLLDSCFANLVEQLKLPNEKYLIFRTKSPFTPVFVTQWGRLVVQRVEGKPILRMV